MNRRQLEDTKRLWRNRVAALPCAYFAKAPTGHPRPQNVRHYFSAVFEPGWRTYTFTTLKMRGDFVKQYEHAEACQDPEPRSKSTPTGRVVSSHPLPQQIPIRTPEGDAIREAYKRHLGKTTDEWQPIETAPKGDLILYAPDVIKDRRGKTHSWRIYIGTANGTPFRPPTYWKPLPSPPEPAS